MSRLIDADKLIKQLDDDIEITKKYVERSIKKNDKDGYIRYSNQLNTLQSYRLIIKDMKTAYDVEKVVKKLKHCQNMLLRELKNATSYSHKQELIENIKHYEYAINIVKAGGIDE